MSDEKGVGSFNPGAGDSGQGGSQPTEPTPSQQEGTVTEDQQPKYITEEALNERLEAIQRQVQSSRDSALSTFDKRIKAKIENVERDIKAWREQGVNISPEQEQQRRLNALQEAILENPDASMTSNQQADARQAGGNEDIVREVNARAYQISQQAGIELQEGDPELLLLDQSSPEAYLSSFRNALYQKRLRSSGSAKPPEARIPSMGQATKVPEGSEEQFIKEYKAAQGLGLQKAREIRQKYMAKGMDVQRLISENF